MALKILLADDSMTAQNMGKKILTDAGYEVVAVSNGAAAVKKIAEINPQLCILDIYMPGYTGLEVCEKIKSSSVTARMPVLLTVGKMEPYKPEEGARVRADGVIVKPFEASELLRAVHRFSQRIAGANAPRPTAPPPPPSPPASTPSTYELTVKLTREQIQEYMDPGSLASWKTGTTSPDMVNTPAARTDATVGVANVAAFKVEDLVANTKTASTADAMPTFAVHTAVAEPEAPAAPAPEVAPVDLAAPSSVALEEHPPTAPEVVPAPASAASASAVLPGFVDYLIASMPSNGASAVAEIDPLLEASTAPAAVEAETLPVEVEAMLETPAEIASAPPTEEAPVVEAASEVVTDSSVEAPAIPEAFVESAPGETVAIPEGEFAVSASAEHVEVPETPTASVEPELVQAVAGERSTGTEALSDELQSAEKIGYDIPTIDPALEVAPAVAVDVTPDPHFEAPQDLQVANATEEGLETTSRAAESAGVVTTEDPNLSVMIGLTDAVHPLEGGRLVIPAKEESGVEAEVAAQETVPEAVVAELAIEEPVTPSDVPPISAEVTPLVEAVVVEDTARVAEAAAEVETADVAAPVVETVASLEAAPIENAAPVAEVPAEIAAEVVADQIDAPATVEEPVAVADAPPAVASPVVEPPAAAEPAPPVEPVPVEAVTASVVEEVVPPVVEAPPPPPPVPTKKSKKGMRPIPSAPPVEEKPQPAVVESSAPPVEAAVPPIIDEKPAAPAAVKADVTEEIAAVLDLLGQTAAPVVPAASGEPSVVASAAVEEAPALPLSIATRVWMAEEVALLDSEAALSLENEMRVAYAPTVVEPENAPPPEACEPHPAPQSEVVAAATPAEEPVRDDKIAPHAAVPDTGDSPPESTASPTQELAAAMAAAFGGALPQEDLARAEETQSISEEVRRFALGDAYKAKPTFGGAAIDDPADKVVDSAKLAAAVSRALDRLKPQLVAEILKELEAMDEN